MNRGLGFAGYNFILSTVRRSRPDLVGWKKVRDGTTLFVIGRCFDSSENRILWMTLTCQTLTVVPLILFT